MTTLDSKKIDTLRNLPGIPGKIFLPLKLVVIMCCFARNSSMRSNFWIELLAGGNPAPAANYTDLNESLHPSGYHHFCIDVPGVDDSPAELRRRGSLAQLRVK